jgi:RAB protein geranylgeranyltransferase component A
MICYTSHQEKVGPKGPHVVAVSTIEQTTNPFDNLRIGLDLLGPIECMAVTQHDVCVPVIPGGMYDSTNDLETTVVEVCDLFEQISGSPGDLKTQ